MLSRWVHFLSLSLHVSLSFTTSLSHPLTTCLTLQALGMLFWHQHNVEKSLADLPNFTPFPDEWTVEDRVLFEQAFSFHGKSFHRIQQMVLLSPPRTRLHRSRHKPPPDHLSVCSPPKLPDRSMSSLVRFYYSWKKSRSKTSLMDRQSRKARRDRGDRWVWEAGRQAGSQTVGQTDRCSDPDATISSVF